MADTTSLTNHLLIAMPSLSDPAFAQTVTLVCEHSVDKGALGIVINKPLPMALSEVLSQMKLEAADTTIGAQIQHYSLEWCDFLQFGDGIEQITCGVLVELIHAHIADIAITP